MARQNRIHFPGAVYHVMSRGNRKSMIVDDDHDRWTFKDTLDEAADDHCVRVYAWCLMGTHYHALLDTPRANLSRFVSKLNTAYSKAFNRRHGRVGHTFQQRFGSIVVQREKYLRRVARYIALNPVRAGLCRDAGDWPWSAHRVTVGVEPAPSWMHLDWLRWAFRADTLAEAQRRYQAYVRDPNGLTWSVDLTSPLGTSRFKRAIAESLACRAEDRPIPIDGRLPGRPSLERVFSGEELDSRSRDGLILAACATYGYRVAEIARFLGARPSTISKGLSRAKRWRAQAGAEQVGQNRRSRFRV